MTEYIEFETADGTKVLIEVATPKHGIAKAGVKDVIRKATAKLEDALGSVKKSFMAVQAQFKEMKADETELTASIKLTSEGNFAIGKVGGEGTLEIKLKWNKNNAPKTV